VVLFGREELVLLRPLEGLLAMTALKYASEVSYPDVLQDELTTPELDREELSLTRTLLQSFARKKFSIAAYKDKYVEELTELIEAKVEGREVVKPPSGENPQVINLMDALKRSVAQAQGGSKAEGGGKAKVGRKVDPAPRRARTTAKRKSG
jgi:DNA end-binding protein Ku